jgi:hypothetical protein
MPRGHAPFALLNRTANLGIGLVLRTPVVHRLVSGKLALITVTGRKSGRTYTFPVGYSQDGDAVRITVGWPERKVWWRNLRDGDAPVWVRIRGTDRTGRAHAEGNPDAGVVVHVQLDPERSR